MADRTIPTYFSHSYRPEDQDANLYFWRAFDKQGFYFSVDPPSDIPTHTHLERMINESSCYVAVVNVRSEAKRYGCSPFILSEFGLSVQAQRPRLMLVDKRISNREPFSKLPPEEVLSFSADPLFVNEAKLTEKIEDLGARALRLPDPALRERKPIGILVPEAKADRAYGGSDVRQEIEAAAALHLFECREIPVPFTHNAMFALDLRDCEAVVLDVRGNTLPSWVFAYVYGRLIPSIKLVRLGSRELPSEIDLPPLVEGLRMDEDEPGVESVIYWRSPDDLLHQLRTTFGKLDKGPIRFNEEHRGLSYFGSIARRPARVFVSNSSAANALAGALVKKLMLNNIDTFHYKEENAIKVGSNWKKKIKAEALSCDVFVALIGEGYSESEWCKKEFNIAKTRARKDEIALFPYNLGVKAPRFLREFHAPDLHDKPKVAIEKVFKVIDAHMKGEESGRNWQARQPLPLGASREAVIDALRHLPRKSWAQLLDRLAAAEIDVRVSATRARIQPREIAEDLVYRVQRSEISAEMAETRSSPLSCLVRQLESMADDRRKPVLKRIALRMRESFRTYP